MITKEQAVESYHGQGFWHTREKNADGTPVRCRVNGKCKVWKTRPDEFKLPVKYGLHVYFYISQFNAKDWYDPYFPGLVPMEEFYGKK